MSTMNTPPEARFIAYCFWVLELLKLYGLTKVNKSVHVSKYFDNRIRRHINEVNCRVAQAKAAIYKIKNVLCNASLLNDVIKIVLRNYVQPTIMYVVNLGQANYNVCCESRTIGKLVRNDVEAVEVWVLKKIDNNNVDR